MKEFGSDFHFVDSYFRNNSDFLKVFRKPVLYASGRQPIIDICVQCRYKRLWIPQYFCYEVVASIKNNNIEVKFYEDYPGCNEVDRIQRISFNEGDALLRMNYFGLRMLRSNDMIPVPVIEDHSHSLLSRWALNSNADWCVASLRKTLPLATGGILWSPKGFKLRVAPDLNEETISLASMRMHAMKTKKAYLMGADVSKDTFLGDFRITEDAFERLSVSAIDKGTIEFLQHFDYQKWYMQKLLNWESLQYMTLKHSVIFQPEELKCSYPFSVVLLFDSKERRDVMSERLICNSIYPAVLWNTPEDVSPAVKDISRRMLSIHCDGRYQVSEMKVLSRKLESILNK